jgi:hypothetical protein
MVSFYCNVSDRMTTFVDTRDYGYKIYIIFHIYYSGLSMLMPFLMALDTKKLVHYTRDWALFQVGCVSKTELSK